MTFNKVREINVSNKAIFQAWKVRRIFMTMLFYLSKLVFSIEKGKWRLMLEH